MGFFSNNICKMKDKIVNIAVQVLPTAKDKHPYAQWMKQS